MQWAKLHPICKDHLIHIEARNLKLEGVKSGVSDYFLAYPMEVIGQALRRNCGGLWLKLKTSSGRLSKPQIEWLERMERRGYAAVAAYGWEAARSAIRAYLGESLENIPSFIKKDQDLCF